MPQSSTGERSGKSRRDFLKSTGALAVSLQAAGASRAVARTAASEQLALLGGPKAVTVPGAEAWRWPRYGQAEEEAVLAVVRRPSYDPIAALERDWREHF